jgi:centromeric protein E
VTKNWGYDYVFGPSASNREIFDTVASHLIDSALEGYNTVMFMYGQTSSGKTFTLFGGGGVPGVIDHSIEALFSRIMSSPDTEYVVKVVFAELYNEELKVGGVCAIFLILK